MNTTTNNTTTRLAFAATIAALCFGAAACGTDHGAASKPSGSRHQTLSSSDLIEAAKANQSAYLRQLRAQQAEQLRAEQADAARWARGYGAHGYGDDRRQPQSKPTRGRATTAHHNPGFDKALLAER
jgi:hypothetical protein